MSSGFVPERKKRPAECSRAADFSAAAFYTELVELACANAEPLSVANPSDELQRGRKRASTLHKCDSTVEIPFAEGGASSQLVSNECPVCHRDIPISESLAQHSASLAHLLSRPDLQDTRPPPPSYGIPASNVGFQLLAKSGWEPYAGSGGLGPGQSGRAEPLVARMKRDRRGLGAANPAGPSPVLRHSAEALPAGAPAAAPRRRKRDLVREAASDARWRKSMLHYLKDV